VSRTLIVMRHCKSAWPVGVRDLERPLNARGERDAPRMGTWIGEHVGAPDEARVSPARRTRQTWGLVSTALGIPREAADFDPGVYEATWWDLLDLIRRCPEQARTLMLLGHNPTMEDLTDELAGSGDPDALKRARLRFPTGAVAVLDSDSPWSKWGSDCAFLRAFATP